jgi:hypothetical protein
MADKIRPVRYFLCVVLFVGPGKHSTLFHLMTDPALEDRFVPVHMHKMVPAICVFLIGEMARDQEIGDVLL